MLVDYIFICEAWYSLLWSLIDQSLINYHIVLDLLAGLIHNRSFLLPLNGHTYPVRHLCTTQLLGVSSRISSCCRTSNSAVPCMSHRWWCDPLGHSSVIWYMGSWHLLPQFTPGHQSDSTRNWTWKLLITKQMAYTHTRIHTYMHTHMYRQIKRKSGTSRLTDQV